MVACYLASGVNAVKVGHSNIHYNNIWRQFADQINGGPTVICLAYYLDFTALLLLERPAQAMAHNRVVIR
jgi:hypothetical protein